ncbi:hypothetical protein D3C84_654850 [compost metagenome]
MTVHLPLARQLEGGQAKHVATVLLGLGGRGQLYPVRQLATDFAIQYLLIRTGVLLEQMGSQIRQTRIALFQHFQVLAFEYPEEAQAFKLIIEQRLGLSHKDIAERLIGL